MRMSPESFDYILSLVSPLISRQTTKLREPISAAERLTLTLRFLASGNSQQSMSFSYRVGRQTVSSIIKETCRAIWQVLNEKYLSAPKLPEDWKNIAEQFMQLWNFPNCIGAIDGKHIAIECPINSGSLYHNYKGFFSIVLLAICDAHYIFSFVNIGDYGSNNDSGVLENSVVGKAFAHDALCVPDPEPVEGCDIPLPYFIVGDDIFGLKTWLLCSFPGRSQLSEAQQIFNYRLSRARRVIENAFGILRARWRVFSRPIQASVETAEEITKAAVCLHNYLRQTNSASYCPSGFVDSEDGSGDVRPGEWRQIVRNDSRGALVNIAPQRGRRYSNSAIEVREALKKYFVSDFGSLPWQWNHVRSRGQIVG